MEPVLVDDLVLVLVPDLVPDLVLELQPFLRVFFFFFVSFLALSCCVCPLVLLRSAVDPGLLRPPPGPGVRPWRVELCFHLRPTWSKAPPSPTETFEEENPGNNIFLRKKEGQERSDVSREEEEGGLPYPFS